MDKAHATLEFRDIGGGQMTVKLLLGGVELLPQEIDMATLSPCQMIAAMTLADLHKKAEAAMAKLNTSKH